MNYAYLAEQIVLMLSGGRLTVEGIDPREIENLCREADQQVGLEMYFQNYKAENQRDVSGEFLVNYQVRLSDDSLTGQKKAILPVSFLSLPKNRGVVKVVIAGTFVDATGVLTPYSAKKSKVVEQIDWSRYESLQSGQLLKWSSVYYYSTVNKNLLILPGCYDKLDFNMVNVTLAAANEMTLTEARALLIIQKVLPMAQLRAGTKPDMVTDQNPKGSK